MPDSEFFYIFADPFGRKDSGIISYIDYPSKFLLLNDIKTGIISRKPRESVPKYRKRLSKTVIDKQKSGCRIIVEAPETDAVTSCIPSGVVDIHIPMHCSR